MSSQLEIAGIEGLCLVRVEKIDQKIPGNLQINRELRSKKVYPILQGSKEVAANPLENHRSHWTENDLKICGFESFLSNPLRWISHCRL